MNTTTPDPQDDFDMIEPDTDFGEFDQGKSGSTLADLWNNNPLVKIGLIVAALVVVVGSIMLFGGEAEKAPDSIVAAGSELKETPGTKDVSPAMREAIEESDQQRLEEAVNSGGSVLPTPIGAPKEQLPVPADTTAQEDPLQRWRAIQEERLREQQTQQVAQQVAVPVQPDPQQQQELANLTSAMSSQMGSLLNNRDPKNLNYMQVTDMQALLERMQAQEQAAAQAQFEQASAQQGAINMGVDPTTGQPLTPVKILIPAGTIEYGQLLIEANSDIQGPVLALVASGPFSGSRILGSFSRTDDYLVLQFNSLTQKNGVTVPIQAIAVDPATTLTGVATEVDRRYFTRIIIPAAARFLQGIGEAVGNKQTGTTVTVNGQTVIQENGDIDVEEQLNKGLERAAERAADVLEDEGNQTQALIRVKAGAPLGILFTSPVTDQDLEAVRFNQNTALQQREQQAQQQSLLQQQQLLQGNSPQLLLLQGLQGAAQGGLQGATQGIPGLQNLNVTPTNQQQTQPQQTR
jgi:intracellular multiplication protein IcmE